MSNDLLLQIDNKTKQKKNLQIKIPHDCAREFHFNSSQIVVLAVGWSTIWKVSNIKQRNFLQHYQEQP